MKFFHISESLGLELRGKYLFSVNMGYSSDIFLIICFLHETRVKFSFKFVYFNGFNESSVYYQTIRVHHMQSCNCYTPLAKFFKAQF